MSDAVLFDPSNPNTGPGLCARRAVAPGETLALLPAACTLRVDDGNTPPALLKVFDEVRRKRGKCECLGMEFRIGGHMSGSLLHRDPP